MLLLWLIAWLLGAAVGRAQSLEPISLPPPRMDGGMPLRQALRERQSTREFSREKLPPQVLADLLWAGFGINRTDTANRTAPSAMNAQELDLYVATAGGVYLYDAAAQRLLPFREGDFRARTGGGDFIKDAPLAILFVADFTRMVKAKPEMRDYFAAVDTGYVSQNVYLFCASEGLATVVHELDKRSLKEALQLRPEQHIILAQSVGFPKKPRSVGGRPGPTPGAGALPAPR